jgi:molybdopterin-guanine dinucleotide biosynthesis protein A
MVEKISGVILAGGESKRFNGLIKSKIMIGGTTIISRAIDTLRMFFDEIIIVTNTPEEFVEYNTCRIVSDVFLNRGPLGGIHSALKESNNEALFVVAGDMPLLDKEIILRQIEYFKKNSCAILIPRVNNYIEPLHGLYRKSLLNSLETYLQEKNDYALREFFKSADVQYLQFEESEKNMRAFTNINSNADVVLVKKLLGLIE